MPEYINKENLIASVVNTVSGATETTHDFLTGSAYRQNEIIDIIKEQPAADVVEVKKFADELCSKFAGHSDYHGDTILSTIRCIAEGKKVGNARPLENKKDDKHGQWTERPSRLGDTLTIYSCSVCDRSFTFRPDYDFCPNCGADMRKKEGVEK